MVSVRVCAIIAGNYLPYARVLADSFFAQHPAGSLTILVIDDEERRVVPDDPRIDWRRLADLGIAQREIHRLAGIYDVTELATAVKPLLLRTLLDEGAGEVIFLDPDICLYAPLDEVIPLVRQHGIVLTPHATQPFPRDGRQIDGRFVLGAGVYNLGFIAVSDAARPFLEWWGEATRREALIDFSRMMFTDQRWVDYAPSFFEPYLLKDPGYNVAYWNLHERTVTQADGQYLANGVPLRFFHFSGFEVQKPWLLSRHQGDRPRVLLSEHPVLARLCRDYVTCLERAGLEVDDPLPYGWRTAAAGIELTPRLRRLYWTALVASEAGDAGGPGRVVEPPDPFDTTHPRDFLDWLNSPAEDGPRRVSRFLYSIYRDRSELRVCFPDLAGPDAARYHEWVWRYGVDQEPALFDMFELLPPRESDDADSQAVESGVAEAHIPRGITIVREFESEEIAQLLKSAVETARLPVSAVDASASDSHGKPAREVVVICLDPARTRTFPYEAAPGFLAGRHRIGYWLWDADPFPAALHAAFDAVDEVWAPTDYVADLLRVANRKPVFTVPLPMPVPTAPVEITREQLGLPADPFLFLSRVDLASDATRQNPVGAINAFRAAFLPGQGPVLAIHLVNAAHHLPELEQIRLAACGRDDVRLLERIYKSDEELALFGTCDAYLSLHHADALGLSIAKAMAVGKPAIATAYSGNLHFMTPENSYLVDCTPSVRCNGPVWVDPDLDHAAQLMREVYDRPFDAACKARRGQADVFERHGLWTSASAIRQRVESIRRERQPEAPAQPVPPPEPAPEIIVRVEEPEEPVFTPPPPAPPAPPAPIPEPTPESAPDVVMTSEAVAALEALVPHLEHLGAPRVGAEGRSLSTMRVAAQRALFRVIQPYSFQQRQFQDALIAALVSSVKSLASHERTLAGDLSASRAESAAQHGQTDARLLAIVERLGDTDTRLQQLAAVDSATEASIAALDSATNASLAALSQRVFVAPFDPGRERFLQHGTDGDTRLGYGATQPALDRHPAPAPAPARVNGYANGHAAAPAVPLFRARQRLYLPLLKHRSRVLDIGCGRGAMLDLLRVARVPAVGIDFDPAMVSHCRANGHTVEQADALQFLRTQPDASVAAIFSARFLEQLPFDQMQEFLRLCRRRLEQGGLLIAENATPAISPEIALALCQQAGFEQAQVVFPTGTGALDPDRHSQPQYAVFATPGTVGVAANPSVSAL
jgi:glycosyltransferase involved in cell wall biosynthesis/SAM-dependent methyltransferase